MHQESVKLLKINEGKEKIRQFQKVKVATEKYRKFI